MRKREIVPIHTNAVFFIGNTIDPPAPMAAGFENEELDDEDIDPDQKRVCFSSVCVDMKHPGVQVINHGHMCGLTMIKQKETGECLIVFTCYQDSLVSVVRSPEDGL